MSVGNTDGNGDELETPGVPSLYLGNNTPLDETLALSVGLVAKATVDTVVQEAVEALAQAVADATQWFADAVRGDLISQAVITADPPDYTGSPAEEEDKHASSSPVASQPRLVDPLPLLTRPPSAAIHAVAKATVDSVTQEAVKKVVRAVENATEWITQAVETELVSRAMDPDEGIALHNATEWLTQDVHSELVAHAVADASPSNTTFEDQQERVDTPDVVPAHDAPRLVKSPVAAIRELATATAEAAVSTALQTVAQAIGDASKWLIQAIRDELLAQVVIDALPDPDDVPQDDEADNNSADFTDLKEQQQQPSPSAEEVDESTNVPILQLPSSAPVSSEAVTDFAVPFVNDVAASAFHEAVPDSSPEPQDEVYDDDYTPINTPTAEEAPSKSPLPSTRSPEQETPFVPPVTLSGRATPPDTKPTPRRKSPITSKRALGAPPSTDNSPSSAPPAVTIVDERSALCSEPEPSHSTLPPLVLPGIQGALLSGRTKHHQHKTPNKTPRYDEARFVSDSSRITPMTSSRLDKHTSRSSIAAELELTPLSSARAAAQIYAQQPPSSRHHHHKSKKLRNAASQTSPPPSPPLTTLPRQPLVGAHDDSHTSELPKSTARLKYSPRDVPSAENGAEKTTDGASNNSLLAPFARTPLAPASADASPPKSSSPSRAHRNHAHRHHKVGGGGGGGGGGPSPNKRSGYCQRCAFEGRSCKINDCLKHQVLK